MLIFEIEQKPVYKSKKVFGIEIPLFGCLSVDEAIAVDKTIATDLNLDKANTEWKIYQVANWLIVRLGLVEKEISLLQQNDPSAEIDTEKVQQKVKDGIFAQLYKSVALIEALWLVFVTERDALTDTYEIDEPVIEGKGDKTAQSQTSKKSGTKSISNLHQVALLQNSEMDLDSNE